MSTNIKNPNTNEIQCILLYENRADITAKLISGTFSNKF